MYTVQFGCFSTVRYLKAPQTNIIKQVIDFWQAACTVTGVNQGPARAGEMFCVTAPATEGPWWLYPTNTG